LSNEPSGRIGRFLRRASVTRPARAVACVGATVASLVAAAPAAAPAGESGIQWPQEQLLPHFAPVEALDVVNMMQRPGDERLLFSTVQGIVNRTQPRIYLIENADEGAETWPSSFTVPQARLEDPWPLVTKYRAELHGVIVYDPAQPASINVATTLAGLRDAVVASPELAQRLAAEPYGLPVLEDLRGRFESDLDAYEWAYDNLWDETTRRMIVGIPPYLGEGFRFADGSASVVYRFDVPAGAEHLRATIEMWNQFEVSATTVDPATAIADDWQVLLKEERQIRDAGNRDTYAADLSQFAGASTVYLRFRDSFPQDGWGAAIRSVSVSADGERAGGFTAATPEERDHIVFEQGTQLSGNQPYGLVRDYAVANRTMVVWLDPGKARDRELDERFLSGMPTNGVYVGWFPGDSRGEREGVELASRHGIITVPADLFSSMTVHSAQELVSPPAPGPRAPEPQDKVYVSFVMTDGDNLQYDQHRLRQLWDDPARGTVPISWSMSPLMLDAAPHMLNHFLGTATPADYLMAGPSGAGYVYPTPYPDQAFESYANVSGRYMRQSGLRGLYALNHVRGHDVGYEPSAARAVERFMRPDGVVLNIFFDAPFRNRTLPGGTPVTSGPIATSVDQAKSQIADAITDWDGSKPRFVTLGVLSWSMGPTQLAEVAASLGDDVEVVRADDLFALMRQADGR
jgi:hypothetical protein